MFQVNDYLVYGNEGVCRVDGIRSLSFEGSGEKLYYVLVPFGKARAQIFVPTEGSLVSKMRPVMTKKEVDAAIDAVAGKKLPWIEDRKRRTALFRTIRAEAKCENLLLMLGCLYGRRRELAALGKKLAFSDSDALFFGETIIHGEFSFALGIACDEVPSYIRSRLERAAAQRVKIQRIE